MTDSVAVPKPTSMLQKMKATVQETLADVQREYPYWFRPKTLAWRTGRPVWFTFLSNPWTENRYTGRCTVRHAGEQYAFEIENVVIEREVQNLLCSQLALGEAPTLVGYECCVECNSGRTSVTLYAADGRRKPLRFD